MPVGFDKVQICNMALGRLGSTEVIESLTENSVNAKQCKLWYDAARIVALEAYNWSFARRSLALSSHNVDAPTYRWAYRYQMPSDCVAPRLIENPAGPTADAVPYEVENAGDGTLSIVTDQATATLIYTFDLTAEALFSMHFVNMLAVQLAVFMNPAITGKRSIADELKKDFFSMRDFAPASDAFSHVSRPERDAACITARA